VVAEKWEVIARRGTWYTCTCDGVCRSALVPAATQASSSFETLPSREHFEFMSVQPCLVPINNSRQTERQGGGRLKAKKGEIGRPSAVLMLVFFLKICGVWFCQCSLPGTR
jgi:hypothetical protein